MRLPTATGFSSRLTSKQSAGCIAPVALQREGSKAVLKAGQWRWRSARRGSCLRMRYSTKPQVHSRTASEKDLAAWSAMPSIAVNDDPQDLQLRQVLDRAEALADVHACKAASTWLVSPTCLRQLCIKDFALITEERITFSPGLNVITGESGSGKSVLVEALGLITGASASHVSVRAPAQCATIEGTYSLDPSTSTAVRALLSTFGLPEKALPDGGKACNLVIRREIVHVQGSLGSQDGSSTRSRCFVNDAATSLRVLRELGSLLVDANAQDSVQSLRDGATQLQLLDRVAGTSELAAHMHQLVGKAHQLEDNLEDLDELADEDERAAMEAMCDAVRKARVEPNEELRLRQGLKNNESRRASVEQCASIRMAVTGQPGGSGGGGVVQALRALEVQLSIIMKQEQQMAAAEKAEKAAAARDSEQEDDDEDEAGADGNGAEDADERRAGAGSKPVAAALQAMSLAREQLGEAETQIKNYARTFQFDAQEHHRVSERLKLLDKLMKTHSCRSTAQLLDSVKEAEEKLQAFYVAEEHEEEWEKQLEEVRQQLQRGVVELSARRRAAAAQLVSGVERCLKELAMSGSRFDVQLGFKAAPKELPISWGTFIPDTISQQLQDGTTPSQTAAAVQQYTQQESAAQGEDGTEPAGQWYRYAAEVGGIDVVEFMLAAGPSEPLRSLSSVASGGESARVMLALKAAPCMADAEVASLWPPGGAVRQGPLGSPVLILDELDSSIGARLGSVVGRILRRMSRPPRAASGQIICVTHLPQVACFADQHVRVKKQQAGDGRVNIMFETLLSDQERVEEVAAMLGLEHEVAAEMFQKAQKQ